MDNGVTSKFVWYRVWDSSTFALNLFFKKDLLLAHLEEYLYIKTEIQSRFRKESKIDPTLSKIFKKKQITEKS